MLAGNLSRINPDTVKLRLHTKKPGKRRVKKNANVDYFIVNHFLQQKQQLDLQMNEVLLRIARRQPSKQDLSIKG